jgi:hypothetical protein
VVFGNARSFERIYCLRLKGWRVSQVGSQEEASGKPLQFLRNHSTSHPRRWSSSYASAVRTSNPTRNKKFWEQPIACFPLTTCYLIRQGQHREHRVQQFYCCVCIRYRNAA